MLAVKSEVESSAICLSPTICDFSGSATVPVASVGVPPTERCVAGKFTLLEATRAPQ